MSNRQDVTRISIADYDTATIEAWKVIKRSNCQTDPREFIFRIGDVPCRFEQQDDGQWAPVPLSESKLRHRLNEVAEWGEVRTPKGGGEPQWIKTQGAAVPRDIATLTLAAPNPPIPVVHRLVETPVLTPKGNIADTPGYNQFAKVFYLPAAGLKMPTVARVPTRADVARARSLLLEDLLVDFPFKSDADKAHVLCMFLQPVVRNLVGMCPLYAVEAPTPGSGKGLVVNLCSLVLSGGDPKLMTPLSAEDEWRKEITSILLKAPSMVVIDNLKSTLDSASLNAMLTSPTWTARHLGFSREVTLPNRALWVVTGNNMSMGTETVRRSVRIMLDSGLENPEDRPVDKFCHPDVRAWALENRGELIWALLTLARAWVKRGRPDGEEVMGGFESWAKVMGGILRVAGVDGLLCNRTEQREQAGSERDRMTEFLHTWRDAHGGSEMKVADLASVVWDAIGLDQFKDKANQSMGYLLKHYANRPFDGVVLRRAQRVDGKAKTIDGKAIWQVESTADPGKVR